MCHRGDGPVVKIAMVGAGSAGFCRKLVQDALTFKAMRDAHFALMDVDAERLDLAHRVMENMREQNDLPCTFSATTDRRIALADADFAISMIQVGGLEPYHIDIDIPMRYGVDQCFGDTVGPGGVFRGLRHVPALLDMAQTMREMSKPDAIFMNYANPMAICMWALHERYPDIASVGVCHGVENTSGMLRRWLDIPKDGIQHLTAGINHLAWFLRYEQHGEDLYPLIWEKLAAEGAPEEERFRFEMLKAFGYFMTESSGDISEYTPYFRTRPDLMGRFAGSGFAGESGYYVRACAEGLERFFGEMRDWASGATPVPFDGEARSNEYASGIMNAKLTGEPFRFAGNVRNEGFITNLPDGCCAEVPTYADRTGLHGTCVGDLPEQCAALCRTSVSVQDLAVKAALEGDPEKVFHACLLDPLTAAALAPHEIRNMVEEMLDAQVRWLPQFAGRKRSAPGWTIGRLDSGQAGVSTGAVVDAQIGHYDKD